MIELIKKYYYAWETNDLEILKSVISTPIFGVRTYLEDKLFTNEELYINFKTNKLNKVEILSYNTIDEVTKLELKIDGVLVATRIVIQDEKIYKVYEIVKSKSRRFKCVCSYDGSSFSGYQKQLNAPSVQETIETAIHKAFKQENISIHSSGRTDKGVHAINQIFHFDFESSIRTDRIKMILNTYLPDSIYMKSVEEVDCTFHSRYDVKEKEYMYKINTQNYNPIQRNYEWFVADLDVDKLNCDLQEIIGTHDFTSFTKKTTKSTTRTIYNAYITKENNCIYIHIKGSGFMRYMVRNIVGVLVSINKGKLKYSMKELIKIQDVNALNDKAPAGGLYLYDVNY
jgi:tRNA pseudouridine38-40 synthase